MATEPIEENPAADKSGFAKSVVVVNTGDGKGKSSSAFGVMVRGVARGWNIAVLQFIKSGEWNVGEEKIGVQLGVDWFNEGEGFTWDSDNIDHDKALASRLHLAVHEACIAPLQVPLHTRRIPTL